MDTEKLLKEAKSRFNHNSSKKYLKDKYQAKLVFADQSGLWCADPKLFSTLQFFTDDEVVLLDMYDNPVKVNRTQLWSKAYSIYRTVMNDWHTEFEELKNKR